MPSILESAECIGVSGDFSVLRDFYGFFKGKLPPDPTGAEVSVSLLREMNELAGEHFHLNIIQVGSDQFSDVSVNGQPTEIDEIDYTIYRMRDIYAAIGVGVGRIEHYGITTAQANGLDSPTRQQQLEDLTNQWTVYNDGIDFFIVHNMNIVSRKGGITLGLSVVDGPCGDKVPEEGEMSGSTGGLWGGDQTSKTAAHEIGHYLSLNHRNKQPNNLMCQARFDNGPRTSIQLVSGQEDKIRGHCFVKSWC